MKNEKRGSGVLLHVSSLPSGYGIGDLGPDAYKFVDFLYDSKQSYWQILPLNPTEPIFGNSPYSSFSAFATNPFLISPELMVKEGLLSEKDLKPIPVFPKEKVDYDLVKEYKLRIFDIAYKNFAKGREHKAAFEKFIKKHASWLDDFAVFFALKEQYSEGMWINWPKKLRDRDPKELEKFVKNNKVAIEKVKFLQYLFIEQWQELKKHCHKKGVRLIGDIPIYVSFDSVDVWMSPNKYKLDKNRKPIFVAGVPPDYFSVTGQRWGNPVYDWDVLKKEGFAWWIERLNQNLEIFDIVRIDHFRGLVAYWEIPAEEETAIKGEWRKVPCYEFLNALIDHFGKLPIIAEDLGIITPDVEAVMEHFELPGMKVLLFAFNGDLNTHPYLPHNFKENCIVYTGTHDNNTVMGWIEGEASEHEINNLRSYVKKEANLNEANWELIELSLGSKAKIAITPLQDVLGLNATARMNTPGTSSGNWEWRFSYERINSSITKKLAEITKRSGRK
ncbi:MAG: 4-alpha-glucanotransferase [Candidatus Omnitrophica bacterium]|nr:4-alpha-glucanotransferase [Candidatus Omnitrophota bacterium]